MVQWADETRGGSPVRNIRAGAHFATLEGEVLMRCPDERAAAKWQPCLWFSNGAYFPDSYDHPFDLVSLKQESPNE